MKYLVRKEEMKRYDANTIDYFGIPSMVLIERAALAAVEELVRDLVLHSRILIACGVGNNGADGLVMARLLNRMGHEVLILTADNPAKATEENRAEYAIAKKYGIMHETFGTFLLHVQNDKDYAGAYHYDMVVDALFGVGLSRKIEGSYEVLIQCLNALTGKKVAVDIPSGIDADDGSVLGVAFRADLTVTFSYEKLGMRLFPGQEYCGEIVCRSVGIDDASFLEAGTGGGCDGNSGDGDAGFPEERKGGRPVTAAFTKADLALIPKRRPRTNKGSYGKVLVIAGSAGMAGAAYFSAKAAYLSGCGLVRILTPEENRVIIQSILPEAVLTTYCSACPSGESDGSMQGKPDMHCGRHDLRELAKDALSWADAVVCGPGLGTSDAARELVHMALHAAVPAILDADALNLLSEEPEMLLKPHAPVIVTPHLGEMARLLKRSVSDIKDCLTKTAEEFARTCDLICVLKDARTVTSVPDGMTYVNLSGNNGMATGGSGDVLTGVIAGLIAQGLEPEKAAPLGVYIHGLAGDEAAVKTGRYSLTAQTLLDALPTVFSDRP